ncbi:hypothetical protein KNU44_gp037 [Mycobacterium phage CicholasNage]|uniref:Uncharacterized protein n=3 Tax=Bronvirus TaxID=1623278 RepID=A0A411BPJ6_9CAUD|nr:hypothetical protein KNU44_gp037 [Mycobacterium phage CicholasNage]YP_010101342.1 hypothetical protein KNU48_gp036 [Mycobacterium phage Silverleaf]AEZ50814.1 hypothetical protein [Mycobacterium phage Fezzik]AZS12191.1 hypothetical protein SEA_ACQUIRE49_37 [Mycobacterium phage Acquire49]QDK04042.1 hypothetical protein SEA_AVADAKEDAVRA_37 [Mycobacterium phage AvadaKedavra]QGJ92442.1 hypothetical protein SEA_WYATT2_37 [Mycobacterium phage Wyatt2]QGJ93057.1 hypothetical protein SEA_ZARIA_37 [M
MHTTHSVLYHTQIVDSALLGTVLAAGCTALYIRRHTWLVRWETAATACIALLCVGTLCLSPQLIVFNPRLSPEIRTDALPGQFLIGYLTLLLAAQMFLLDLAGRMVWECAAKARYMNLYVVLPGTIMLPTVIGLWTAQSWWVMEILAVSLIYTLSHIGYLLWRIKRTDPRSGIVVDLYLAAFVFQVAAPLTRWFAPVSLWEPWGWRFWSFAALLFMAAASISWIRKRRYIKLHMWQRIRAEKPLKRKTSRREHRRHKTAH